MKTNKRGSSQLPLTLSLFTFLLFEVLASGHRGPSVEQFFHARSPGRRRAQQSSEAYVTLLYGDEFALGVRVLGKSIRDTGTTKDMVVLASEGVSQRAIELLEADGWIVERIELLANPNSERPKRFWGVYTKLKIFNMTNYRKVAYLDADTIVRKSIEDLFQCQKFCANLKHSERLNSGVMVIEPSRETFEDMMTKVNTLPSYTGGDQGFLNSYYSNFPNAHLFDPSLSEKERIARPIPTMERLSTLYNADVGLYMLANKWMVDENELRVVHYTLGPLKPWDWWTAWLLEPVHYWQDVRVTLEDSLPGTRGGQDPQTRFFVRVLIAGPLLILLFLCRHCLFQIHQSILLNGSFIGCTRHLVYKHKTGNGLPYYSAMNGSPPHVSPHVSHQQYANGTLGACSSNTLPAYLRGLSVGACFLMAGISFGVAVFLVPRQVMPLTGLLLLYEWTFFLFGLMFSRYLGAMFLWGRMSSAASVSANTSLQYDSTKGNLKQPNSWDCKTLLYGLVMACLAVLAPCLPFLFGVTALFARKNRKQGLSSMAEDGSKAWAFKASAARERFRCKRTRECRSGLWLTGQGSHSGSTFLEELELDLNGCATYSHALGFLVLQVDISIVGYLAILWSLELYFC